MLDGKERRTEIIIGRSFVGESMGALFRSQAGLIDSRRGDRSPALYPLRLPAPSLLLLIVPFDFFYFFCFIEQFVCHLLLQSSFEFLWQFFRSFVFLFFVMNLRTIQWL